MSKIPNQLRQEIAEMILEGRFEDVIKLNNEIMEVMKDLKEICQMGNKTLENIISGVLND